MTDTFDRQSWARDLLTRMGYPVNDNNLTSVLAWENQEGGHTNGATWNPLNSTLGHATYGTFNSAGVATYPDYETGMAETIKTLRLHYYDQVRADLQAGAAPATTTGDIKASPWGTWHGKLTPTRDVQHAASQLAAHPASTAAPTAPAPTAPAPAATVAAPATGAAGAGYLGADVDGLDELSREFTTASEVVTTVKTVCEAIVAAASMFGPFGAAFVAYLKGTVIPWLAAIAEALQAMSRVLATHSQAQKDASSASPSSYRTPTGLPSTSTATFPVLGTAAPSTSTATSTATAVTAAAPLIGAL